MFRWCCVVLLAGFLMSTALIHDRMWCDVERTNAPRAAKLFRGCGAKLDAVEACKKASMCHYKVRSCAFPA
jgi:hypothetical protein